MARRSAKGAKNKTPKSSIDVIGEEEKERKGKEEYLYSAIYILCISESAQAWITQFYLLITTCLLFLRKRSPDGATPD